MVEVNSSVARFPSLVAMRDAHSQLLQRQRDAGDTGAFPPDLMAAVEDFVTRGRATGALLDEDRERQAAQTLLDYWVTRLYRVGYEPDSTTLDDFDPSLAPELPDEPCPYLGLNAFGEQDRRFFFGRQKLLDELLAKLNTRRLVAVVGASGSGKSSLILGGLIPALKQGALPGSDVWRYVTMVPGSDPMRNLERVMQAAVAQPLATAQQPLTIVLVVDQFEEAFTLCTDDKLREAFITELLRRTQSPNASDIVILTMRADFVDSLARYPALQSAVEAGQVNVRALDINELREAIEGPAAQVGLKFEEGIVDDLITSILGERAGLPLLQFTLLQLWEKRDRNRVTREVYQQVGSPRQALERSAEAFYNRLIPEEQRTLRRILLTMVKPGVGLEYTSSRVRRAEVYTAGEARDRVDRVLDRLINEARLVRLTRGETPDDDQIEVAHEALIRNWPRLVDWLEDERARLRQRFLLRDVARQWDANQRDASLLLRGRALEEAEGYDDLNDLERQFVQASREAVNAAERAKEEARQRELRRLRWLAAALAALALVAAVLAGYAVIQRNQAQQSAQAAEFARATAEAAKAGAEASRNDALNAQATSDANAAVASSAKSTAEAGQKVARSAQAAAESESQVSHSREFAAIAINTLSVNAQRSISIALKADSITHTVESEDALRRSLHAFPQFTLRGHTERVVDSAFSPDGARAVTTSDDGTARVWDIETGKLITTLTGHQGAVVSARFSPDGKRVITAGADGTARLWDLTDGKAPVVLRAQAARLEAAPPQAAPLRSVQFSPDGERALTVGEDGTARVWDIESRRELFRLKGENYGVSSAQFSPDGARILTVNDDRRARIWDAGDGRPVAESKEQSQGISDAEFSPNGKRVVTAGFDNLALVWDTESGKLVELRGPDFAFRKAHFSSDGQRIVTVSADLVTRLWDAITGKRLAELPGPDLDVIDAIFSPDGKYVLVVTDQKARLSDTQNLNEIIVLGGHDSPITGAHFSPDGRRILTTSEDKTARIHVVNFEDVLEAAKKAVQ